MGSPRCVLGRGYPDACCGREGLKGRAMTLSNTKKERIISLNFYLQAAVASVSVPSLLQLGAASEASGHAGRTWTSAGTEIPILAHSPLLQQASAGSSQWPVPHT